MIDPSCSYFGYSLLIWLNFMMDFHGGRFPRLLRARRARPGELGPARLFASVVAYWMHRCATPLSMQAEHANVCVIYLKWKSPSSLARFTADTTSLNHPPSSAGVVTAEV